MICGHRHDYTTVIEDAQAEFPKRNTPDPVRISGTAYGCRCGRWEFQALPGWPRVEVTPPPEMRFKS